MKLISCYVSSFGKLKDFNFDFSQGLNTIKQDNGWGKSTLASFLKAMFYGLNSSKRSVAENERIRFRPWNSTQKFGGYIHFEWGENQYKIERYFGLKESEDSVRLFDLKTGKEFSNTENLGKRIFEIDEEGFFSTTYFSQKEFEIKSNTSLTAKFNSVCDIQDADTFDKAVVKLEEKAKLYKYRGDKGLISDVKREIVEVDFELEKANKSLQALNVLKDEILVLTDLEKDLKSKINLKAKEISVAGETQAIKVKKQHYEQLVLQKNQVVAKLEKVEKVVNNNTTNKEEINNYLVCHQDLLTAKTNQQILRTDIEKLSEGKTNSSQNKAPKNNKILILLSILCTLLSVGGFFINLFVGIALIGISLMFTMASVLTLTKKPTKNALSDQLDALINEKQQGLIKYVNLEKEISTAIDLFLSKFNVDNVSDRVEALNEILDALNERERLKNELSDINQKILELEKENQSLSSTDSSFKDISSLRTELEGLQAEYSLRANELASKNANLTYHENVANTIVDLESKKQELVQKLQDYTKEYKILTLTSEYLKKADENLKVKYRAPLQDSLNKYLNKIVEGGFNAQIDIDLNVSVQEIDGERHTDYYSKGYQNLIEICKRFALTDVLFKKEKPFIILDDPFYNLDDQKIKNALALINELSKDYQIIYFICHDSRRG